VKLHVLYAPQELLLKCMEPKNALNAAQENTKSTEPHVLTVQRVHLLWLDLQAKLHAPYVQQELLPSGLDPKNALHVKQELTKSTEPPALTAQRVLLLSLAPQVKFHAPYAQQELLLSGLEPKNALNVAQENTKSTEPLAMIAQRVLLLSLAPQAKLHVPYAQ